MRYIMVTALIDPDGLEPLKRDDDHEYGLSDAGHLDMLQRLSAAGLEEIEFEVVNR